MTSMDLNHLPVELLSTVFALAQNPELRLANKRLHHISKQDTVRAKYLLHRCADQQIGNESATENAIPFSVGHGLFNVKTLSILVRLGVNLHGLNGFLLRWSAARGNLAMLQHVYALSHDKATFKACAQSNNDYALRVACQNGHVEIVQQLMDWSVCDIHADTNFAVRSAMQHRHFNVVQHLLAHGADPRADNDYLLRMAASYGNLPLVEQLEQLGSNPRAESDEALVLACVHGHSSVAEWLVKQGRCQAQSLNSMPVRAAVEHQHWSIVQWLVTEAGAHLDDRVVRSLLQQERWDILLPLYHTGQLSVNGQKGLALWTACSVSCDLKLAQQLVKLGADLTLRRDLLQCTLKRRVTHNQAPAIVAWLSRALASVSIKEVPHGMRSSMIHGRSLTKAV